MVSPTRFEGLPFRRNEEHVSQEQLAGQGMLLCVCGVCLQLVERGGMMKKISDHEQKHIQNGA